MINDSHNVPMSSELDPEWIAELWSSLEEPMDKDRSTQKELGRGEYHRLDAPFLGFAVSLGTAVIVALLLQ